MMNAIVLIALQWWKLATLLALLAACCPGCN